MFRASTVVAVVISFAGLAGSAFAAPYQRVFINSQASVTDPAPDSLTSGGPAAQLSAYADFRNLAYSNGSGGFTIKRQMDDVFARASLSEGHLKARSILGFANNVQVTGAPLNIGQRNGAANATAAFGDSFSTRWGSSPFVWSDGDEASFQFGITGTYSVPGNVVAPANTNPGQIRNQVYASLNFQALTPGGLALREQLANFDFINRPMSEYYALNDQYEATRIDGGNGFWFIGNPIVGFSLGSTPVLALNPSGPTFVDMSFNPSGDFEWFLELDTTVHLDATLQNTTATLDFSHTISTVYTGPVGTTTVSESGVFPGTVPAPGAMPLLLAGAALAARRRRQSSFPESR